MKPHVTVALTSVYGGDAPSAGLVAAQMLRRQQALDVRLIVLATDAFADGIQGVHVADHVVVVPPLARDPEAFVARIRDLARKERRLVLVPGSPGDTIALASWEPALRRAGVRAILPRATRLPELPFPANGQGVRSPRHLVVAGSNRLQALRRAWRYPVGVRWADGEQAWAYNPTDLHAILAAGPAGAVAGVYEAVPGIEISVATLARDSAPASLVVARPLHVSENGVVWSAVTMANPRLVADARRAVAALRWRGPAEARFTLDDGGRLWFTGLTPGFPSWVSLTAAAGQDLVLQYVQLALGARPGRPSTFADEVFQARVSVDHPTTIDVLRQLVTEGETSHAARSRDHLRTAAPDHAHAPLHQ